MDQLDEEQFLKWLVHELTPICSEEPDVLAQYVEALIKDEDMNKDDLKKHCVSELTDFLDDNTESFVERMFSAIDDGSYKNIPAGIDDSLNDSIRVDSPPSDRRRDSSASAFDDEEEESENHRRRKLQETDDDRNNKRQRNDHRDASGQRDNRDRRDNNNFNNKDRQRHGNVMPNRNAPGVVEGGKGGGKGGGRQPPRPFNNHMGNMNNMPMNMPMGGGGGFADNFGGVNMPMGGGFGGGKGGGMWGSDSGAGRGGGGFGQFPGAPPPEPMWNMNSNMTMNMPPNNDMMFAPPQQQQPFGAPPPPPLPPPPNPNTREQWNMQGGMDDGFQPHEDFQHPNMSFQGGFQAPLPIAPPLPHHSPSSQNRPYPGYPDNASGRGSEEQCTVKCSGIPHYVKEIDLYKHFISFGRVIKLVLHRLGGDGGEEEGRAKVYNEALVQFEDESEAKKCLGSPQSVLDNRFIKLFSSKENIIPSSDVPHFLESDDAEVYPGFYSDEKQLKLKQGGKGGKGGGKGGKGGGRMGGKGGRFGGRGGQETTSSDDILSNPEDEEAAQKLKEQQKLAAKAKREDLKEKREQETKHQYEELKQLRHQADSITRKKEELLQGQIDQFRGMMSKVEKICGTDEAEKARMIDSLEKKVMSLQAALQDVRNGQVSAPELDGVAGGVGGKGYKGGGYRGGGGRGKGGYKGSGGRFGGRGGKGKGGRGGKGAGRGERSLDNRSKSLVISGAPDDFLGNAHLHFSKFGEVVQTSKVADGDSTTGSAQYVVEFSNVHGAESALRGGMNFNNSTLTAEYKAKKPRADSIGSNPPTSSQDDAA